MGDDEGARLPDAARCQSRCAEFAAITATDEACAQSFLKDHDWDLARSLNSYCKARTSGAGVHVVPGGAGSEASAIVTVDDETVNSLAGRKRNDGVIAVDSGDSDSAPKLAEEPPKKFSLITWNLDGLDTHDLRLRTWAALKIIEVEAPDIVLLQELVASTCAYLTVRLPQYQLIRGGDTRYFTATLLRKDRVYYDTHCVIKYKHTSMSRNLLCVEGHIGPLKLTLLNTHLESTGALAKVRQKQLRAALLKLGRVDADRVAVLAGDLNLRDFDVSAIGGLPADVHDLWKRCGARTELQYAWDMQRNTNHRMPCRFQPRCRFDRVYLRESARVRPDHFDLIGLEKVTGTQSFPSDHWGIQVFFSVT